LTETENKSTAFPEIKPVDAGQELGRFMTAMHRYLHVDYCEITPIDEPLQSHGRIDTIDGQKAFVMATMTDSDGNVLSEASGLMIRLPPHQP
jgi:hypothetical protein